MPAGVQALALLLIPLGILWLTRRSKVLESLSPVVLCYLLGILLTNLRLVELEREVTIQVASGAVILGIPLLLFSADFLRWLRLARTTLISSLLCFGSMALVATLSGLVLAPHVADGWQVAGMLTGTYTGSAPNMIAVGHALGAQAETLVVLTAADLLVAGSYALFLLSPGVALFAWILPPFERTAGKETAGKDLPGAERPTEGEWGGAILLGLIIAAAGAATTLLVPEGAQSVVAILTVTTLGIAGSFAPPIRRNRASYPLGDYFLLVFCLAFGTLADLRELASSTGTVLLWTAIVMVGGVALHLLLCRLLGIDRDTAVITATAAIYTPAFVGPVAANLKNPELVISGIGSALVGIALGNYLGLGVAYLVRAAVG